MTESRQAGHAASARLADFSELWDYSNPTATEQKFRELLPVAIAAGDSEYHGQLLTQIARAEGLQNKFAEAHITLDAVASHLDELAPVVRVRYLLERGRVYNSADQPDRALPLFREAWDVAQAENLESYAADAAHMLGIVATGAESLEWNERAIALAERSADPATRRWLGPLYNNVGWTHHDQGNYATALRYFEQALVVRLQSPDIRPIRIARWTIARCQRSLGRVAESLAAQQALLADFKSTGDEDGFVWEELGECHLALGDAAAARPYFALAHAKLSQDDWLAAHEPQRLQRLKELGEEANP